jgi:hypothetical protein
MTPKPDSAPTPTEIAATLRAAAEAFAEVAHHQRAAGAILGGAQARQAEQNARTAEAHADTALSLIARLRVRATPAAPETFAARVDRAVSEVMTWARVQESPALNLSTHELRQVLWVGVRAADADARSTEQSQRVVPVGTPSGIPTREVRT